MVMQNVPIVLAHTTVNVIMVTLVMVMNAVISTSVASMSATSMPHALINLVHMTASAMTDTLVREMYAMMLMNAWMKVYAPKTPFARTMMVPLLVNVIMDILVMVSTRATNWTIWPFTTRTQKNGRVPMAITDRHFLAKMIMNAFSILVQPTQNVPILSVLSNVNVMTDIPVTDLIA